MNTHTIHTSSEGEYMNTHTIHVHTSSEGEYMNTHTIHTQLGETHVHTPLRGQVIPGVIELVGHSTQSHQVTAQSIT